MNSDPYGDGWLFRIVAIDLAELGELIDADAYQDVVDED